MFHKREINVPYNFKKFLYSNMLRRFTSLVVGTKIKIIEIPIHSDRRFIHLYQHRNRRIVPTMMNTIPTRVTGVSRITTRVDYGINYFLG